MAEWRRGAVSLADALSRPRRKHSADLAVLLLGMPYLLGPTTAAGVTPGDALKKGGAAGAPPISDSFGGGEVKQLWRTASSCEGSRPDAWTGGGGPPRRSRVGAAAL